MFLLETEHVSVRVTSMSSRGCFYLYTCLCIIKKIKIKCQSRDWVIHNPMQTRDWAVCSKYWIYKSTMYFPGLKTGFLMVFHFASSFLTVGTQNMRYCSYSMLLANRILRKSATLIIKSSPLTNLYNWNVYTVGINLLFPPTPEIENHYSFFLTTILNNYTCL